MMENTNKKLEKLDLNLNLKIGRQLCIAAEQYPSMI